MKISYEDLLSGDSVFLDGVGHIHSPFLWQLKPTKGIGYWKYNFYLNLLTWDKDGFIGLLKMTSGRRLKVIENKDKVGVFEIISLFSVARCLLLEAMSFFMDEQINWDEKTHQFVTQTKDTQEQVGAINKTNFEEVRDAMAQMNYASSGKQFQKPKFSSDSARLLWEKVQEKLQKQKVNPVKHDVRMELGNIISKLCAFSPTYNLLNVYDLTVYQLYDQFFQLGYARAMDLNDMAYSNHGGKKYDMQMWLNPLQKK